MNKTKPSDPFDTGTEIAPAPRRAGNVDHAIARAQEPQAGTIDFSPLVNMASSFDRDEAYLIERAAWLGSMMGSAAYYDFPVGSQRIVGPSIGLAEALAGEWGAIAHEMLIVSAIPLPSGGQRVHLRARAIDLKRIVIGVADAVVSTPPPSAKFAAKQDQVERWHAMQIQSAGSKIKRNALLDVIPAWLVNIAMDAALAQDEANVLRGRTPAQAAAATAEAFAGEGLAKADLEAVIGQPLALWAIPQLMAARELWKDLKAGRSTIATIKAELAARAGKSATSQRAYAGPQATPPAAIEQDSDLLADIEAAALAQRQPDAVPVEHEPASVPPVARAVVVPLSRDDLKAKIARAETALGQQVVWPIRTRMSLPLEQSVAALRHSPAVLEEYLTALQGALDAREAALDADDAT